MQYDNEGGQYLLAFSQKNLTPANNNVIQGTSISSAFTGRDRLAVLRKPQELAILDCGNVLKKKINLPFHTLQIYPAGISKIVLVTDENIVLFDVTS